MLEILLKLFVELKQDSHFFQHLL